MTLHSDKKFVCRWGILATGAVATDFCRDLLHSTASDVSHIVVAAASSTSQARAQEFLESVSASSQARAYGSYAELLVDSDVDIIYIATPHQLHFQDCINALNAGKNVLCEKPFTVNAEQLKIVVALAHAKGVFMMEGVWTRFFPISKKAREIVSAGTIGEVVRVTADLSLPRMQDPYWMEIYRLGKHRMVNPNLAGGALLNFGVYALTWVYQILYHLQPASAKRSPTVTGNLHPMTDAPDSVDASNVVVCTFRNTIGIATSSIRTATDPTGKGGPSAVAVRISGTKGEIQILHPANCPNSLILYENNGEAQGNRMDFMLPEGAQGFFYEADEVARCLRDKKTECDIMPLEESVLILEAVDTVRAIGRLRYPDAVESARLD